MPQNMHNHLHFPYEANGVQSNLLKVSPFGGEASF
jgi:hypothetical protein